MDEKTKITPEELLFETQWLAKDFLDLLYKTSKVLVLRNVTMILALACFLILSAMHGSLLGFISFSVFICINILGLIFSWRRYKLARTIFKHEDLLEATKAVTELRRYVNKSL